MRKHLVLFKLLLVLTLLGHSPSAAAQTCGNCAPGVKQGFTPGSPLTIYMDSSLSAKELLAAYDAIYAWNARYYQAGTPAPFTFTGNPALANVTIREDPNISASSGAEFDPATMLITTNPTYSQRADGFLDNVMSHEIGHAIGFTDVYSSNCQGSTVMYGYIDPSSGNYTTGPTTTDQCKLSEFGGSSGNTGDGTLDQCDTEWGCAEPIVFNLGDGSYNLTGLDDPVVFDIFAAGLPAGKRHIGWTAREVPMAFLAVDRNENGLIDGGGELFGNGTLLRNGQHAANGFDALAEYDENGDGEINEADRMWQYLLLWVDRNHDGISQASELQHIDASSITAIELVHHWTNRRDQSGNYLGFEGHFHEGRRVRPFYDVFFVIGH